MMPLILSLHKKEVTEGTKLKAECNFLKEYFSLFMIDDEALNRNMWLLSIRSKGGLSIGEIERMAFWRYERYVDIANKLAEEEKDERKKQEEKQKNQSQNKSANPSSYLNKISGMANKFKS